MSNHENLPIREWAFLFSGDDHISWLQGQISNDVRLLESQEVVEFCWLKRTGQIEGLGRLRSQDDRTLLITDAPEILEERLEQFVIMEDVVVQAMGEHWFEAKIDEQSAWFGLRKLEMPGSRREEWVKDWLLQSLSHGVPLRGIDFDSTNFPQELGHLFESGTISYTKGCFLGQEVIHRIHSRGHVNKVWKVFKTNPGESQVVTFQGREVGKLTRREGELAGVWLSKPETLNFEELEYEGQKIHSL